MKRGTWKRTVRGAHMRVRFKSDRVKAWRGLWMSPAYALLRHALRKEDAWSVAQRKLNALDMRRHRIALGYGM